MRRLKRWFGALLPLWGWLPRPLRWLIMWTINPKYVVGVAAVVFNPQGEVMLFRHTYRRDFPWALPGGWLKRSEDPARAVEREIMEESGLSVCIGRPWQVQTWPTGDFRDGYLLDIVFVGQLIGGTFTSSAEVSEVGFFNLDTLPHIDRDTRHLLESVLLDRARST